MICRRTAMTNGQRISSRISYLSITDRTHENKEFALIRSLIFMGRARANVE